MALYPGAKHRLIGRHNGANNKKMAVYNRMNMHVAVSEATSLFGFFSGSGVCSHFYIARDGGVEQYIDTAYRSRADLDGNDATISVETQGGVNNPNGEPWTDAQVASAARLFVWVCATHGIPMKLATNSKSGDEGSRGLSWHRLGVKGNFPALPSILAGRDQRGGGMLYSSSAGKVCPGNRKIEQIPDILAIAQGGQAAPTPSPAPASAAVGDVYTVVAGDTLSKIGKRAGVAWQTIASLNGIPAPYHLRPGQVLRIRGAAPAAPARRTFGTPFPLAAGHYLGMYSKTNPRNHSGSLASDRKYVKAWLNVLRARGWKVPDTDRYTAAVKALTVAYQKDAGLDPDGLVGALTWTHAHTSPIR